MGRCWKQWRSPAKRAAGWISREKKGLVHSVEEKKEGTSEVAFINRGRAVPGKRKARVLYGAITAVAIISFSIAKNGRKPGKG